MNPDNPLLIYRNWFMTLKSDLADLLSLEIFKSLCQLGEHDNDLISLFEKRKHNSIYNGSPRGKLIEFIDILILLNEAFANQRTAVILLSATTFFLQATKAELSQRAQKVRHKLFNSLLMGDDETIEHCEDELDSIDWANRSKAEIWHSWITLCRNDFSYQAIHAYLITEFSKRNQP